MATCTRSSRRSRSRAATPKAARSWAAKAHCGAEGRSLSRRERGAATRPARRDGQRRSASGQAVNPQKRRAIFERLRAADPSPASELEHRSPYELLVAVVLSAQATDKGVNKATAKLFPVSQHAGRHRRARRRRAHSLRAVDRTLPQQGEEHRRALGNPPARARRARAREPRRAGAAAGRGPQDRQRRAERRVRTADHRRRHAYLPSRQSHWASPRAKDPDEVERKLVKFVPDEFKLHAHHWLILHGRYVCVARSPHCADVHARRPLRIPPEDSVAALFNSLARRSPAFPDRGVEQAPRRADADGPRAHRRRDHRAASRVPRDARNAGGEPRPRFPSRKRRRQSVPAPVAASRRRRTARDRPAARHSRRVRTDPHCAWGDEHERSTRCSNAWGKCCGTRSATAPRPTPHSTSRASRGSAEVMEPAP